MLAVRGRPQLLRPIDVTSGLLDRADLPACIRALRQTPLPASGDIFAQFGLPTDAPYGLCSQAGGVVTTRVPCV